MATTLSFARGARFVGVCLGMWAVASLCMAAQDAPPPAGSVDQPTEPAQTTAQEDLDEAVSTKLLANSMRDFEQVVRLCESALNKGLAGDSQLLAKRLLASTCYERSERLCEAIFGGERPDARWQQIRVVAMIDLDRCTTHMPELADAWLLMARLQSLPGGDPARVRGSLDKLLEHVPAEARESRYEALVMRSAIQERPEDRLADLDAAVALDATEPVALRLRGATQLALGKLPEALADFDAALQLAPDDVMTLQAHGQALERLGRLDEARQSFDRAQKLQPNNIEPLLNRAKLAILERKYEESLADIEAAMKIDADSLAALLLRAQVRMMQEETELALADIQRMLQLRPDLVQAHRARADILIRAQRYAEAIESLEALRRQTPGQLEVLLMLTQLYRQEKKYDRAIELLDAAVNMHPDNGQLRSSRADLLLSCGKHQQAVADLEHALKSRPDDSGVLNNLAWLLATSPDDQLRNGQRAVELALRACEQTEYKQAHILSTLAAGYAEAGNYEQAVKWSKQSLDLVDESADELRAGLTKELANYQAGRPHREQLNEDDPSAQGQSSPGQQPDPSQQPEPSQPAEPAQPETGNKPSEADKKPADEKPADGQPN